MMQWLKPLLAGVAILAAHAVPITADEGEKLVNAETSIAWVCAAYPERMAGLFEQMDLDRAGLETAKAAVAKGDYVAASSALLEYYRTGKSGQWLRWTKPPDTSEQRDEQADAILKDTFTYYMQTDRVPRRPDGGLQWHHRGPSKDWEWTLALNRHFHLQSLLTAYRHSGYRPYAERIDTDLRDWIRFSLPYPARKNFGDIWRGLEISFRVKAWASVFYALQQDDTLTPAARLLLLTSLPEHADHLRRFHGGGNWLTMELSVLGMIGAAWPEFKESANWMAYASSKLTRELASQVYPDGVQHELTSHYHWVALHNFEQFAEICRGARIPLPAAYAAGLEKMWHYLAAAMRPSGYGPLNNDSDLDFNCDGVLLAAKTYSRPDWAYIASNGTEGENPDYGASVMFPWAGHFVMRSGWGTDALWAFFDLGPWGTGHQHNDKLHLSLSAHGRDLLVDSGRFVYAGKNARFRKAYARTSHAHNLILVDGKGQKSGRRLAKQAIADSDYSVAPDLVFARGMCNHFVAAGKTVHTRLVVYLDEDLIVVADRIDTDRARKLETLWHWHPTCTVAIDDATVVSTHANEGNLRIAPLAEFTWSARLVSGQKKPHLQGWYSPRYNEWEPNPTAILTADVAGTVAFAWILHTAKGEVGKVGGDVLENKEDALIVRIDIPGKQAMKVTIPWHKGEPLVAR